MANSPWLMADSSARSSAKGRRARTRRPCHCRGCSSRWSSSSSGSVVVDGGESIEIARGGFLGNLGPAVEVGNAPAERTPGHAAFAVALLAPVDAEVVAVMEG